MGCVKSRDVDICAAGTHEVFVDASYEFEFGVIKKHKSNTTCSTGSATKAHPGKHLLDSTAPGVSGIFAPSTRPPPAIAVAAPSAFVNVKYCTRTMPVDFNLQGLNLGVPAMIAAHAVERPLAT